MHADVLHSMRDQAKLATLEDNEVILDNEQHDEINAVVEAVHAEKLEKLFQKGELHMLAALWTEQRKEFPMIKSRTGRFLFDIFGAIVYCFV